MSTDRKRLPLSADLLMGICPADGAAVVWAERSAFDAIDFVIVGKDAAYNARRLAHLLLLAAEAVDPVTLDALDDEIEGIADPRTCAQVRTCRRVHDERG